MINRIFNFPSIGLLFLLQACSGGSSISNSNDATPASNNQVTLTSAQETNAAIRLIQPDSGQLVQRLPVNGVIDVPPQNMVSISFPLGGYLKSTALLPGMPVKKGQVIATMEDPQIIQLQQDFLTARARLAQVEADYSRQEKLNTTKTTSDKAFEQVRGDYQAQRILVRALQEKLELIGLQANQLSEDRISRSVTIHSPINGFVSAVNVNIGKYVNPSEVLFELVNPEDLHLALTVFEKDLHLLQPNQKVRARLTSNPSEVFLATIILISKNLDANRSATVHCHFDVATHDLLPGMFLQAEVEVMSAQGLVIPAEAVVRHGSNEFVFVSLGEHRYERVPVTVSLRDAERVLLDDATGKAIATSKLVRKGAYSLLMMMENKAD